MKSETTKIKIEKLGDEYEVVIKDTLDMNEMLVFVNETVSNIINIEDDTYLPELKKFFIDAEILVRYANFKLPEDTERQYMFIANNPDIVQTVVSYINQVQLQDMIASIDEKIEYEKSVAISAMSYQFKQLADQMEDYAEKAQAFLEDVGSEDMAKAIRTLGNPDAIDERKIVKAVFDSQKE